MSRGSLTVVGTGFLAGGQTTPEAHVCIGRAEKLFYLVSDPVTRVWLEDLNPTAESLYGCYVEDKPRRQSYTEMVDRILASVRAGLNVCVALYGHPGVFVNPSHEAIVQARREGYSARMLPGISAEDCLFADLGVDPALHGCLSFEASYFLTRDLRFDPTCSLILWQIGAIGVTTYRNTKLWNQEGLDALRDFLMEHYAADHEVIVYEASQFPVCPPLILPVRLAKLSEAKVSAVSTLYVPPVGPAPLNLKMCHRLGLA